MQVDASRQPVTSAALSRGAAGPLGELVVCRGGDGFGGWVVLVLPMQSGCRWRDGPGGDWACLGVWYVRWCSPRCLFRPLWSCGFDLVWLSVGGGKDANRRANWSADPRWGPEGTGSSASARRAAGRDSTGRAVAACKPIRRSALAHPHRANQTQPTSVSRPRTTAALHPNSRLHHSPYPLLGQPAVSAALGTTTPPG